MARELPIVSQFNEMLRSSMGYNVAGWVRTLWDSIVPSKPILPPEFSDRSRPAWGIQSVSYWTIGFAHYQSCSITSAVDIAIEEFSVAIYKKTATVGWRFEPYIVYTPDASYIPFLNATAYWIPWIRPRITFDTGNTIVVTGHNPLVYGVAGLYGYSSGTNPTGSGYPFFVSHKFDPPLILPATMFLTVQTASVANAIDLYVNWRYREIG